MGFQEAFNDCVRVMKQQDWQRSVDADGQCMYRSPSGRRCAIGALLPDEILETQMEKEGDYETLISINENNPSFESLPDQVKLWLYEKYELDPNSEASERFFEELQTAHDGAAFLHPMTERFVIFAMKYGLTVTTGG